MHRLSSSLIILILALAIVPTASAHAPIGSGDNESLDTAPRVADPTKSWAIYGELHEGGEANYYQFDAAQGQRIHLMLLTTTSAADATFTPGLVLMGPGLPSRGAVPSFVQTPPGATLLAQSGARPATATYEAFGPSAYLQLADIALDAPASGTYVVAVQNADRGGHYGLAIGDRESFTLAEWLLNPFSLLSVYTWERQSLALVLAPALAVMALGLWLLIRRQLGGRRLDVIGWLAALAGLACLGTGATVAAQMLWSLSQAPADGLVMVTLLFALLPVLMGGLALRLAVRSSNQWTGRSRLYLVLLCAGALLVWAGYLIGPALALVAAILPAKWAGLPALQTQARASRGKLPPRPIA